MNQFSELLKGMEFPGQAVYESTDSPSDYKRPAFNVVSTMGFLIGVKKKEFDREDNPAMQLVIYDRLHANKNARIIRNLCIVRTCMEKHYMPIVNAFKNERKNIDTVIEYIPAESITELYEDGIRLARSHRDIDQYIIDVNNHISSRISNVQNVFPEWLNWNYIKDLFIMPNGSKKDGIKEEGAYYNSDRNRYPYTCYMNWSMDGRGNILYCDEKFVTLVYECHQEIFEDKSLVRNAGDLATGSLNEFLMESQNTIFVVDCENSNPVKLAGVLGELSDELKSHIKSVLLFDSHYTNAGWGILSEESEESFKEDENLFDWNSLETTAGVKMEHIIVERLIESKSQVDLTLATRTSMEVYKNGVDAVILVSSDSDYWAMIKNMEGVRFLVMLEREKTSVKIKESLDSKGIHHCFIDDFYTGMSYNNKIDTIKKYIQTYLDKNASINAGELLDSAVRNSWLEMKPKERKTFFDKYLKKAHVEVDENERLRIVLGEK